MTPIPKKLALVASTLALGVGAAAVAAAPASADFNLNSGNLSITPASATGTPPSSGSWVKLHTDDHTGYFPNLTSGTASTEYTRVAGLNGLNLGTYQSSGGIFNTSTSQFLGAGFDGVTISSAGNPAPELTFSGSASGSGTRTLVNSNTGTGDLSDLTAFRINYAGTPGALYNVGSRKIGSTTSRYLVELSGSITGDATDPDNPAPYVLDWETDIDETPAFAPFTAQFHWEGQYTP